MVVAQLVEQCPTFTELWFSSQHCTGRYGGTVESQVSLSSIISGRDKTLYEKQANKNNDQADFLRVQRRASQLLGTLLTIQSQLENQFL